jgi:putative ABC transport system substrate-binding protein
MRRRDFITLVGGAAVAGWAPSRAWSQGAGRTYRLGVLANAPRNAAHWVAFFDELRSHDFVEGVNLLILDGFSAPPDRVDTIAATMVEARPDAVLTGGATLTRVMQRATQTIPILAFSDDLVAEKAVASLARPGGNTTGMSILATELDGKRQEILLELVPAARRIAALADPDVTGPQQLQVLNGAANGRGVTLAVHVISEPDGILPAIDAALAGGAQALNVLASSLFNRYRAQIIERVAVGRLPAIYQWPETAEEGGLIAYGPRFVSMFRQYALQAIKVLKGAKPADIPVEQPTKFELIVNLKTAKAIGLEVSTVLLNRADEVIE